MSSALPAFSVVSDPSTSGVPDGLPNPKPTGFPMLPAGFPKPPKPPKAPVFEEGGEVPNKFDEAGLSEIPPLPDDGVMANGFEVEVGVVSPNVRGAGEEVLFDDTPKGDGADGLNIEAPKVEGADELDAKGFEGAGDED